MRPGGPWPTVAWTPEQIVGVGCTAQWSGTVAVDAEGAAIGPSIIWLDSRGATAVRRAVRGALNVQGYSATKAAKWVRRTGGIPSLSGKDPVGHIHFLREQRPEVYAATAVFLEPVDYLTLRLTGLARASHDSITLHWVTDNRDITAIAYDDSLFELAGLERRTLPELVPTGSVLGGLTAVAAAELGLVPGTPVVAGTGDLHSAAVGSGAVRGLRRAPLHRHVELDQLPRPLQEDGRVDQHRLHPLGAARPLPGGRRARDGGRLPDLAAGQPPLSGRRARSGRRASRRRLRPAQRDGGRGLRPGRGGVLFTPWLNGERSPVDDHTIRGGFHNISLSTTRADMVRAVFEGVALNSAWLLGAVEKYTKRRFPSLAFVGGGANSDLWSQVHADAMGREIRQIVDPVLANVRGAGLLTHLALGHLRAGRHPVHGRGEEGLHARPGRRRRLRPAPQGVRQPLRQDEGHSQAVERRSGQRARGLTGRAPIPAGVELDSS